MSSHVASGRWPSTGEGKEGGGGMRVRGSRAVTDADKAREWPTRSLYQPRQPEERMARAHGLRTIVFSSRPIVVDNKDIDKRFLQRLPKQARSGTISHALCHNMM